MTKGMSPVKLFGNNIYFRYLLIKKSQNLFNNMKFDLVLYFLVHFCNCYFLSAKMQCNILNISMSKGLINGIHSSFHSLCGTCLFLFFKQF